MTMTTILFMKPFESGLNVCCKYIGNIQVLRNQEVPPTGLGKYDGVMMPVLRQGWVVKQNMT